MAVRRASTDLLAQRFLHLRISPRPTNLSESREILRILQRFGEVSKFYSLKFEYHSPVPNSALLIYRSPSAAQAALAASPIRFALERTHHDPKPAIETDDFENTTAIPHQDLNSDTNEPPPLVPGISEILSPSSLLTRTSPAPSSPSPETKDTTTTTAAAAPAFPFQPPKPKTTSRWFQITVDRSRAIHQDYVERQPFWKQFAPAKSIAQLDLVKKVPHEGLSDVSKRPPHAYRTPNHVLAAMNKHLQRGQECLENIWEEGERQRKGEVIREDWK